MTDEPVMVVGDSNRDGRIDIDDLYNHHQWSWAYGAFTLANLDDDDGDGKADCNDLVVNGEADERDIAQLRIFAPLISGMEGSNLTIDWNDAPIHVFRKTDSGWTLVNKGKSFQIGPEAEVTLGLEALCFAGMQGWNGHIQLRVTRVSPQGSPLGEDSVAVRVAPWLMLPNSARTRIFYIATGKYDNAFMLKELEQILPGLGTKFPVPYKTAKWQEMWMQDTMEMGYSEIPGGGRMHVVLNGIRGADSFGPTLLGKDVGVITVGYNRNMSGHDAWADWYGNLEVSHPTPEHPFGRIYYGCNTDSGATLHPEVVHFLKLQELQSPIWVDTSWLAIKHVDEIFNFIPGPDGKGMMTVGSPAEAARVTGTTLDAFNLDIQAKVEKMLSGGEYKIGGSLVKYDGVYRLLGFSSERTLFLPVLFNPVEVDSSSARPGAHNRWSNPVNSVFVNGSLVTGGAYVPEAVRADLRKKLQGAGVRDVYFVDDRVYQDRWGNVHCSSNTCREPLFDEFWKYIPNR